MSITLSYEDKNSIEKLENFLSKIPSVKSIGSGVFPNRNWWVKFDIDINHELAWNVVQELGSVLNYLSVEERLPTVFMPVSPPPYLNGGPKEFLSWVIESEDPKFKPDICAKSLEGRLPRPIDDISQWPKEENNN